MNNDKHDAIKFQCSVCGHVFNRFPALVIHSETQHPHLRTLTPTDAILKAQRFAVYRKQRIPQPEWEQRFRAEQQA